MIVFCEKIKKRYLRRMGTIVLRSFRDGGRKAAVCTDGLRLGSRTR